MFIYIKLVMDNKEILYDIEILDDIENECPICLENLSNLDIAVLSCPKKHRFHFVCIGKWIYSNNNKEKFTCPLCLVKDVVVEDVEKVEGNILISKIYNTDSVYSPPIILNRFNDKEVSDIELPFSPRYSRHNRHSTHSRYVELTPQNKDEVDVGCCLNPECIIL